MKGADDLDKDHSNRTEMKGPGYKSVAKAGNKGCRGQRASGGQQRPVQKGVSLRHGGTIQDQGGQQTWGMTTLRTLQGPGLWGPKIPQGLLS